MFFGAYLGGRMQAQVTQLFIYPVKSCAAIELQQSALTYGGLKWDRQWVVVDADGHMLTQRTVPRMTLIQPSLTETELCLNAPEMPALRVSLLQEPQAALRIQIWDDLTWGSDQGDSVALWLSQFLQQPCRLLRVHPKAQRGLSQTWVRKWLQAQLAPETALGLSKTHFGFADGFPFLICNEASLEELNQHIQQHGDQPIAMNRFRPNIVLAGLEAYDEDHVLSLKGAGMHFAKLKNCTRCPLPNVNPETAEIGQQPALALRDSRRTVQGVTFGVNAALYDLEAEAQIEVGQYLEVEFNF